MPSTLASLSRPICTKFWTYRNLNSTCLVFSPVPKLVAIDLQAVLSVRARLTLYLYLLLTAFGHSLLQWLGSPNRQHPCPLPFPFIPLIPLPRPLYPLLFPFSFPLNIPLPSNPCPLSLYIPLHFLPFPFHPFFSFQSSYIHVGLALVINPTTRHNQMPALDVAVNNLQCFIEGVDDEHSNEDDGIMHHHSSALTT